jgi:predicted amidohydrolase
MQFFFPRGPHAFDETVLLQNLNYIWAYNEPSFRQQLGPVYDLHTRVLTTWIEERTRIQQLQHAIDANPAVPPSEMVDRLLAMNDLRVLRLKWRSLTAQDVNNRLLSAEDLLCKTFAAMTKTEGTENMFREGLQALNERVFEFLKTEDMKITVAGT